MQPNPSTPVVKKDSFSDAEGVSFLKKLLQRETCPAKPEKNLNVENPESANNLFALKKCHSTGNNSYWTRWTNCEPNKSQNLNNNSSPGFLRKLFEQKKDSTERCVDNTEKSHSVAQKASFFMKLEHDQRFSKWRKNSNTEEKSPNLDSRPKSRHLTQPVTPNEVELATNYYQKSDNTTQVQVSNVVCDGQNFWDGNQNRVDKNSEKLECKVPSSNIGEYFFKNIFEHCVF